MNAIELLEKQHHAMHELLNSLKESPAGGERSERFKKLQQALLVHMLLEEEIFYPTVMNHAPEAEPFVEGYEENAATRAFLGRCARVLEHDGFFQLRIGTLEEMLSHHVARERKSMFFSACEVFDSTELEVIGQTMESLIEQLVFASIANVKLDLASTARVLRAQRA
jgi:hypothetical protein